MSAFFECVPMVSAGGRQTIYLNVRLVGEGPLLVPQLLRDESGPLIALPASEILTPLRELRKEWVPGVMEWIGRTGLDLEQAGRDGVEWERILAGLEIDPDPIPVLRNGQRIIRPEIEITPGAGPGSHTFLGYEAVARIPGASRGWTADFRLRACGERVLSASRLAQALKWAVVKSRLGVKHRPEFGKCRAVVQGTVIQEEREVGNAAVCAGR